VPVYIPPSTQRVPDGYVALPNRLWFGSFYPGDSLRIGYASGQADPGTSRDDFDIIVFDSDTGQHTQEWNGFYSAKNASFSWLNGAIQSNQRVELQGGGTPTPPSSGTLFQFSLEVLRAQGGFNGTADQQLTDIQRLVDRSRYVPLVTLQQICVSTEIVLQLGTLAVSWTIDQVPAGTTVTSGLPPYYYRLGFATPRLTWGYARSTRITFTPQLLELPPACDRVAFTLTPGTCITVTEYASIPDVTAPG
jgi:hypothetical protein